MAVEMNKPGKAVLRIQSEKRPGARSPGLFASHSHADCLRSGYQIKHAFGLTILAGVLHPHALANSDMFDSGPFTRNRAAACGFVNA